MLPRTLDANKKMNKSFKWLKENLIIENTLTK